MIDAHVHLWEKQLGRVDGLPVYDIGGGTGSVAIEIAGVDPSLSVITIEKDPAAVGLIERNRQKSGALNLTVIEGDAVEEIPKLESRTVFSSAEAAAG